MKNFKLTLITATLLLMLPLIAQSQIRITNKQVFCNMLTAEIYNDSTASVVIKIEYSGLYVSGTLPGCPNGFYIDVGGKTTAKHGEIDQPFLCPTFTEEYTIPPGNSPTYFYLTVVNACGLSVYWTAFTTVSYKASGAVIGNILK